MGSVTVVSCQYMLFLISNEWEDHFSGSVQYVLPKPTSDHFPILLDGGGVRSGPMPFRFENMWLKEEGFKEKMQGDWNKLEFGKVEVNKALALSQVDFWDKMELSRTLSVQEVDAKRGAKEDFKKWALMEEISWRQKSREVWLSEGDRNTKFFHKMANAHRRGNMLSRVKINGWRPSLRGLFFERLEAVDAASLEEPFSEQEVMEALKGFCGDKAPGPDGFSMAFWQSSWEFVKEEVLGFFREFHNHGRFVKSLNATFIVLIPKKGGAEDLRDFRPISLVGGLYKWLAKVLANRLKRVVGKVVSKAQNAFVQGRQILDAVLVANEVFFQSSRGLRQGDPLSPYLFVLVMEAFSSLLRKAVAGGFVSACKARSRVVQLLHLNWILMWFEAMSGLRINLDKSELIPVGCVNNVEELAAAIGCKVGSLPTSYLGLPLGAQYRKVRLRLERIQREFLWGGGALERKIHLVKWELVCLEKDNGGLGGKIWGGARGWEFKGSKGGDAWCGFVETLRKEWEVVKSRLVFVVGNGKRIKFWKDIWCGDEPLCVSFPSLFALAVSKDAWVKDVWRCNEGGGSWSPLFSRPFNDWELEEVCSFFVALNRKQIQQGVDDRVIWRETKCGMFSVKSLYKSLVSGHPISFPSSAIWKVTVQPKVSFFGWVATWGKALTLDQLQRRGWALANRCYLCQKHEESIDHILLHCEKVRTLWVLLYSMFGVQWVLPATVKETLSGWNGSFVGRRGRVFGKQVLCAFFGRFGRQGTKLLLRKRSCQSKDSRLLLFIFFGWRRRGL
ncbi:putative ribonuclease H protein [Vitis vinifera]|uniref:Putative ribonuclease H protein n=1 Tax=Vitis vinifera TaxID=29760 RepID=A0A438JKL3_VITVI|nr:putative ribonuclease H protein [Vitis vinifera]